VADKTTEKGLESITPAALGGGAVRDHPGTKDAAKANERRREAQRWLVAGKQELDEKRYETAADAFDRAVTLHDDENKEALSLLRKARELASEHKEKRVALQTALRSGQQALQQSRYEEAVKQYQFALKLEPENRDAKEGADRPSDLPARTLP